MERFQLCVIPNLKFCAKTAGIVNGVAKGASEGGLNGANGGNGLTKFVPAFCDHGSLRERGVFRPPCRVNVGLNGLMSAVWLYREYCSGAVNIPNAARIEVFGRKPGCQATPTRGSQ